MSLRELPDTSANWMLKSKLPLGEKQGNVRTMQILIGEDVERYFQQSRTTAYLHAHLHACLLLGYDPSPETKGKLVEHIRLMEAKKTPRETMQEKLQEARDLKLDQRDWSYDYQPGITINGPKYLAALYEKYKIK